MLTQFAPQFQIGSTERFLSPHPGFAFLVGAAHRLHALDELDLPASAGPHTVYAPSMYPLTLAGMVACGATCLDDVAAFGQDPGLLRLLNVTRLPGATSLGKWLREAQDTLIQSLVRAGTRLAVNEVKRQNLKRIILDPDATLIESHKQTAQKTYEGFRGYAPMVVTEATTQMVWYTEFREGNDSPNARAVKVLEACLAEVPEGVAVDLRADSAWYIAAVMNHCSAQGIRFTITADKDRAVLSAIAGIPEGDWKPLAPGSSEALATTVHSLEKTKLAYTLVVLRTKEPQQAGQTELLYRYHAIITNRTDSPQSLLHFHRQRGTDEHLNEVLKNDLAGGQLPCGTFQANAAYWGVVCWTQNLLQAAKQALPAKWQSFRPKALRFRLLNVAALVVKTGRKVWLKLQTHWPWRKEVEDLWTWCGA